MPGVAVVTDTPGPTPGTPLIDQTRIDVLGLVSATDPMNRVGVEESESAGWMVKTVGSGAVN